MSGAGGGPRLVEPCAQVQASFLGAVEELVADGCAAPGSILGRWIDGHAADWESAAGFDRFLAYLRADALPGTPRPQGLVHQHTWWLVDGTDYLGRVSVRPHLGNEFLRTLGGHVGYEVPPGQRGRGHATTMLREVLPHVHAVGVDPALVTCDVDNVASVTVIERALADTGGAFLDVTSGKRRYHLTTGGR